jgi:hypothetical protein
LHCIDCDRDVPKGKDRCPWCNGMNLIAGIRPRGGKGGNDPSDGDAAAGTSDHRVCLNCGREASEGSLLCRSCSEKLDIENIPVPEEDEQPILPIIGKQSASKSTVFNTLGHFGRLYLAIGLLIMGAATLLIKYSPSGTMGFFGIRNISNTTILRVLLAIGFIVLVIFSTIKEFRSTEKRFRAIARLCIRTGVVIVLLFVLYMLMLRR